MLLVLILLPIVTDHAEATSWKGKMIPPVYGDFPITSPYGPRVHPITGEVGKHHGGVDIGVGSGTEVVAVCDGTIEFAGDLGGYGAVYLAFPDDEYGTLYATYMHVVPAVSTGQSVRQGDLIAYVSEKDGASTGAHLHFGIQLSTGSSSDPGNTLRPGDYVPQLVGAESDFPANAKAQSRVKLLWDAAFSFGEPLKEITDTFIKACSEGITLLKTAILYIFYILITIDLVYGTSIMVVDSQKGNGIFTWLMSKTMLYLILIYILENWAGVIANLFRDYFTFMGAETMGRTASDAQTLLSNPYFLFQSAANIVTPIVEEVAKLSGWTSMLEVLILLISLVIIFGLLSIITFKIVMTIIEFYIIMLFSFTMFMLSGTKQTRRFASRTFNGIFAISAKLMFFCIFAFMMQMVMENLVVDSAFTTRPAISDAEMAKATGDFGGEEGLEAFANAVRQVESTGNYDVYHNSTPGGPPDASSSGAYGAYQQMPEYWDGRCREFENAYNYQIHLCRTAENCPSNPSNAPDYTEFAWCPENQDRVSRHMMLMLYREKGSWRSVAAAWYGADSDEYWGKICNAGAGGKPGEITLIDYAILLKLIFVILAFMFIGDRIEKTTLKSYGGKGFRFSNDEEQ